MNILKLLMVIFKKNKILFRINNYSKYNLKKIISKKKIRIILLIRMILIILKMKFKT